MEPAEPRSQGSGAAREPHSRAHRVGRRIAETTTGEVGARVGLGARGTVFLVFAYLVIRVATGAVDSGPVSGPGIADTIAAQTGGRIALAVLAVGLALYALFGLIDAASHHDREPSGAKRWGNRLLAAWGVLVYVAFSVYCVHTVLAPAASEQTSAQAQRQDTEASARVLAWPAGWLWLVLTGVVLLTAAAFLLSQAARRSFRNELDRDSMSPLLWRIAVVLGIGGHLARSTLFAVVGWFVLRAGIVNDPDAGKGLDGSIRALATGAAGPYLLWPLALGLVSYGLFVLIESRHRHV